MTKENIRNFSIIAHIDHGKSTLADRLLEITGAVSKREMKDQILDNMDLERERGITIKLNAVKLNYKYKGEDYVINLIDTPGHVDFSYEVSRSLAACEGAILVVDAAQGIEAQTLANLYLAMEQDLTIIPVINKIDLPNADIPRVKKELIEVLGFNENDIILCSAKTGKGVQDILDAVIEKIPEPKINVDKPTRALIFDSYFDPYRGVVLLVKLEDGKIKIGDTIKMMATNSTFEVVELGVHTPKEEKYNELKSGEVGYVAASIKDISTVSVGDTITVVGREATEPIKGYKKMKPMVFSGIFPTEPNRYEELKEALIKLKLNDAALSFEPETSEALGFGFRIGFLGLLHMDVIITRIEREFNIGIIATSPSVVYEVTLTDGTIENVDAPSKMPEKTKINYIKEPYIYTNIIAPSEYIGAIMELCQNKRGIYKSVDYIDATRIDVHYEIPLSEIVYDFYDRLKSTTKGYASFDYELCGYKESSLVKMDILLNGEIVDALSIIIHKDFAYQKGRAIVKKLRELIPRQMFQIPIQASIGSKVIARENISALKKNVLAKCYGGDVSRKRKLLEKQKEGKKRMKMVGTVEVPQEAFLAVLGDE
ncbi:elongation factor 4 [Firmicutes bacterium CAG:460]|jgi:GTP-binding protein LepA|uniref:translation elongation factor 4 n=1 Tax=Candidatus Onthocola sp. TaxID=3085646 RepID=UPI0003350F29|nr:elongation factor 4 [Firmicutes bacterium CAG:460]